MTDYTGWYYDELFSIVKERGDIVLKAVWRKTEDVCDQRGLLFIESGKLRLLWEDTYFPNISAICLYLDESGFSRAKSMGADGERGNASNRTLGSYAILDNFIDIETGLSLKELIGLVTYSTTKVKNKVCKTEVKKDKTPKYLFNMMREISGRGIYNEKFLQLNGISHSNVIAMLKNKGIVNKKQYESYMINTTLIQFCNDMGIQHTEVKVS